MDGLLQWLRQLQLNNLADLALVLISSLLCITVHETCHGLVAWWMGDDTAKRQGRLTLNPLRHIDPMGLLMMAVARFGWAKPVPVDMRRFRSPKVGMALTALAGPLSNVLLALICAVLQVLVLYIHVQNPTGATEYLWLFLEYSILLSSGLAVFNLFPIPPLDGSKILFSVLPHKWYRVLMNYERWGMLLMVVLLLTGILDRPLLYLRNGLLDGLAMICQPLYSLMN